MFISLQDKLKNIHFYEYWTAFTALLIAASGNILVSWPSPTIPKLEEEGFIDKDQGSWLIAVFGIGAIFGPFISVIVMDKLGRKIGLLCGAIPFLISWILIGTAYNVAMLYVARIFSGIGYGWISSIIPIYLTEIASTNSRGKISTLLLIMSKTGYLFTYAIGPYVSVQEMAWIGLSPIILFIILFIWSPESPYFLLGKNKMFPAEKSLKKLRQNNDVKDELEKIAKTIELSREEKRGHIRDFLTKANYKRLLMILVLSSSQQLSGNIPILGYAETIFREVGSALNPAEASVLFGIAQVLSAFICILFSDRFGKRTLIICSIAGMGVSCLCMGTFFLVARYMDVTVVGWLPLLFLIAYIFTFCIGMAQLPLIILGEICQKHMKAIGAIIYIVNSGILSIVVGKLFEVISTGLGMDVVFFVLAFVCFIFVPIFWFSIMETRGKSMLEIQEEINVLNKIDKSEN